MGRRAREVAYLLPPNPSDPRLADADALIRLTRVAERLERVAEALTRLPRADGVATPPPETRGA
jgi:hypothetical protein